MAQTALANLGINFEHTLGADNYKNSYDANWIITDWSLQPWIVNATTTAEPGGPQVGDAYLLGATRTGADWGSDTGSVANSIAIYAGIPGLADASAWIYLAPREGWRLYDRSANKWRFFNGSVWAYASRNVRKITASSYEPVLEDEDGTVYINNTAHTLNLPDNATVPYRLGARLLFVNQDAVNPITVTDDAAVTYLGANLVSNGIPAGELVELEKTATDEWSVIRAEAVPT